MAFLRRFFNGLTENDAPFYGDVGCDANDLFTDDLDHQKVKIKISSKSGENFEFKTTGEHNRETAVSTGKVELKYKNAGHGATYSESWDLENNVSSRLEVEKMVHNRPLNIDIGGGVLPLHESKYSLDGTIKYSHPNASFVCSGKYKGDGLVSNHSVVLGKSGLFIGGRISFDLFNKQVEGKEVLVGLRGGSHQLTIGLTDNFDRMKTSIFHQVHPTFSYGIKGHHCFSENVSGLAGAFKFNLNDISTIRGTLNNCGLLGLSYRHVIRPSISLIFTTEINTLNFSSGNHRTGLSLELTP